MRRLLFLILLVPLQLFAQSDCLFTQTGSLSALQCQNITVEQELINSNKESMTLIFRDGFSMNVTFTHSTFGLKQNFKYILGKRTKSHLNNKDIFLIEQIHQEIIQQDLEDQFQLIQYFASLPQNESLDGLTQPSGEVPWPSDKDDDDKDPLKNNTQKEASTNREQRALTYRSACNAVGKLMKASFVIGTTRYTKNLPVGQPASRCAGRCGFGCKKIGDINRAIYTKECLDHDYCHRQMGENLGVCALYFVRAIPGFLYAPKCA